MTIKERRSMRVFLAIVLMLGLALAGQQANAALTFDAQGSADVLLSGPTSPQSFNNQTVGSCVNRALLVIVASITQGLTESATWDNGGTNQAMTHIFTADQNAGNPNGEIQYFGLVAPTAGNKTLQISWTGTASSDFYIDALSYCGADQTGGTTTFYNAACVGCSALQTSATPAITCVNSAGDAAVDTAFVTVAGTQSSPTQTQIFLDTGGALSNAGASRALGSANIAFQWSTGNASSNWTDTCVAVKAGASCPHNLLTMGVGC